MALVDDEDFERANKFKWYVWERDDRKYAIRNLLRPEKHSTQGLHQFILSSSNIDHKDRDGLNCQKSNLRPCTKSQNAMNQKIQSGCSSKYKGVSVRKNGRISAKIKINQKQIGLGDFKTEELAALAYNKKAVELFGEFAKLNTIQWY